MGGKQVRFQHGKCCPPIGARHLHIEKDGIRLLQDCLGHSLASIRGFHHPPLGKKFQAKSGYFPNIVFVVNDKNTSQTNTSWSFKGYPVNSTRSVL